MSRQRDQLLGHKDDNDGIEEYDNPLPDWWIGMFIFSILFAVGYTAEYHFISGRSQADAYVAQLEEAKVLWPEFGKAKGVPSDPESIASGGELFAANCVSCHGAELQGGIGPNLTDKVWINGGTPDGIAATITNGVGAKGMPAWGPILGPEKVSHLAAFVVSKGGALAPGEASATPEPVVDAPAADTDAAPVEIAAFDPSEITEEMLEAGEAVFTANCVACHKADLTGLVGPNLIDDEWIHGGQLTDIVRTVTVGVPEKGMMTWGPILGDEKIRQVSAYIYDKGQED